MITDTLLGYTTRFVQSKHGLRLNTTAVPWDYSPQPVSGVRGLHEKQGCFKKKINKLNLVNFQRHKRGGSPRTACGPFSVKVLQQNYIAS